MKSALICGVSGQDEANKSAVTQLERIASGSEEHLYPGNISVVRDWEWATEYVEAMYLMLQQQADDYALALRRKQ